MCLSTHSSHEACLRRRAGCESCRLFWSCVNNLASLGWPSSMSFPVLCAARRSFGDLRGLVQPATSSSREAALGCCVACTEARGHHHDSGVRLGPRLDETLRSARVRLRLQQGEHVTQLRLNAANECIPSIVER